MTSLLRSFAKTSPVALPRASLVCPGFLKLKETGPGANRAEAFRGNHRLMSGRILSLPRREGALSNPACIWQGPGMSRYRTFRIDFGRDDNINFHMHLDVDDLAHRHLISHFSIDLFYEHELTLFLGLALRRGDCFVDVGANAGYFSLFASRLVGPQGIVHAVEANPRNAALLAHNIKLNGLENVRLTEKAASDAEGVIEFAAFASGDSNGAIWNPRNEGDAAVEKLTVAATRLDAIVDRVPRVIKIDTEGAEPKVLAGAERLLSQGVPFIVAELNIGGLLAFGSSPRELRGFMRSRGYETFIFSPRGELPTYVPPGTEIRTAYVTNILFARPDALSECWPTVTTESAVEIKERENAARS